MELFRQDVSAAVGEEHNEIHHHNHKVIVPAICFRDSGIFRNMVDADLFLAAF